MLQNREEYLESSRKRTKKFKRELLQLNRQRADLKLAIEREERLVKLCTESSQVEAIRAGQEQERREIKQEYQDLQSAFAPGKELDIDTVITLIQRRESRAKELRKIRK